MRLAIALLFACKPAAPTAEPPAVVRIASDASQRGRSNDAPPPHRFTGDHAELELYEITAPTKPAPSFDTFTIGVVPRFESRIFGLNDMFELVDANGVTSPIAVTHVFDSPHNGGGEVPHTSGGYIVELQPPLVIELTLQFARPIRPPAVFLRLHIETEQLDVPLPFAASR